MVRSPGWLFALALVLGSAVSGCSDRRDTARQAPVGTSPQDERPISEAKAKGEAAKARLTSGARFEAGESLLLEIPVRWIPSGRFTMGSSSSEEGRVSNESQHEVVLSRGFFLAETECTQGQWAAVMGGNPSHFKGMDRPVEQVSWEEAVEFCRKLTAKQRQEGILPEGWEWRLPTEAEWEHAARAGTTGARHGELDKIAWHRGDSGGETHAVKGKQANAWGLHDMMGNVSEWCGDWYGEYPTGSVTDPAGPAGPIEISDEEVEKILKGGAVSGSISAPISARVFRGGSWDSNAGFVRTANRGWLDPGERSDVLGFRPVLGSGSLKTARQARVNGQAHDETAISEAKAKGEAAKARLTSGARFEAGESLLLEIPVRWIPAGRFLMGSPSSDLERDEVQHEVVLSRGFFMAETECTQAQWEAVMGRNPSYFKGKDLPVEQVNWGEAVEFCRKLTAKQRQEGVLPEGWEWRLPTESEWEYAARAGTTGARHGELDAIAWHGGNSGSKTHGVKGKEANAWGLHDMIGNVWEWCGDWYGDYPTGSVTDPTGPGWGSYRVFRGGSWHLDARYARSASRFTFVPGRRRNFFLGFRPALSPVR
jgi:formylglycine-generating enzyme required for sulfatase activity